MKNYIFAILMLVVFASCGNSGTTEPADDESRGYYPQENVDESTIQAVSPDPQDSTRAPVDTTAEFDK